MPPSSPHAPWRRNSRAALLAVLTLLPLPAGAGEGSAAGDGAGGAEPWLRIGGSVRAAYFSASRSLDGREHLPGAALYLDARARLAEGASAYFEGWVRNGRLFEAEATEGKLRQGYGDLSLGPLDLRIGKQLIPWGRADRVNPTDNLTPRDFTLLVPEEDDQRFGVPGLKARLQAAGLELTGIWLPAFSPHTIPFPRQPGVNVREIKPGFALGRSQWAARIERTGGTVDWSLSYFNGIDPWPDLGVGRVTLAPAPFGFTPTSVEVLLRHHRLRVIGADAAVNLGRFGLRGEAAYTFTQDAKGRDPEIKNPSLFLVVGADRTFLEYLNINLQYLFRVVVNFRDPAHLPDPVRRPVALEQAVVANQRDRFQHGATARVGYKWLSETLEAEVAALYWFTRGDYAIRPKVIYAFTDRLKGTVGADIFRGDRNTFFGRLRDSTGAFAELKFSF